MAISDPTTTTTNDARLVQERSQAEQEQRAILNKRTARARSLEAARVELANHKTMIGVAVDQAAQAPDRETRRQYAQQVEEMNRRRREMEQHIEDLMRGIAAQDAEEDAVLEQLKRQLEQYDALHVTVGNDRPLPVDAPPQQDETAIVALRQKVANADADLAQLAQELEEITARLPALALQIASKQRQLENARKRSEQAGATVSQLGEQLGLAEANDRISRGTLDPQEKQELVALRKHLQTAQKEAEALATERDRLSKVAEPALQRLRDEQERLLVRQQEIPRQQDLLERARARTFARLGEEMNRQVAIQLVLDEAKVTAAQRALDEAKAQRLAHVRAGIDTLARWPQHQPALIAQIPLEGDPSVAILEAEIGYLDAILLHGRSLPSVIDVPAFVPFHGHIDWQLEIPREELFIRENLRSGNPTLLKSRRARCVEAVKQRKEQIYRR